MRRKVEGGECGRERVCERERGVLKQIICKSGNSVNTDVVGQYVNTQTLKTIIIKTSHKLSINISPCYDNITSLTTRLPLSPLPLPSPFPSPPLSLSPSSSLSLSLTSMKLALIYSDP